MEQVNNFEEFEQEIKKLKLEAGLEK